MLVRRKRPLKHLIYWIRVCIAFPILFLGFGVEDVGIWVCKMSYKICHVGDKFQELAVNIEGEMPDEKAASPAVRKS